MGTTFWELKLTSDGRLAVGREGTVDRPLEGFKQVVFVEDADDLERLGPGSLVVALGRTAGKTLTSIDRFAAKIERRGGVGLVTSRDIDAPLPASTGDFPIILKPRELEWPAVLQPLLDLHPGFSATPDPESSRRRLLAQILDKHGRVDIGEREAKGIGMDLGGSTRIIVVQPMALIDAPKLTKLEEVVATELLEQDPLSTALNHEGLVVGTESIGLTGSSIPARLLFKSRNSMKDVDIMVGVGNLHPGVEGLFRSFREARWAARVGVQQSGPNSVIHFDDLGTDAWLEPFDFACGGRSSSAVEKLSEHDVVNGTRLVETLITYLDSGRAKEAADRLFIHRNTLRYRLDCVRKLTGLDPHQQASRLVLDIQLRLAAAQGVIAPAEELDVEILEEEEPALAAGD